MPPNFSPSFSPGVCPSSARLALFICLPSDVSSSAAPQTCMGLQVEGRLQRPHAEFDNEQVRYEHRFWPFSAVVTPPPVQYGHYRHMTGAVPPDQVSRDGEVVK